MAKNDIKKIRFRISGMHCASCAANIERILAWTDGVKKAQVNLATETCDVEYDASKLKISDLEKTITDIGYGVVNEKDSQQADLSARADLKKKLVRIAFGFGFGIPLMILGFIPTHAHFPMSYLMLALSTPVFIFVSYPIFNAAWHALKNRTLNMDVMYSMGIGIAYVSSVMGTLHLVLTEEFMFYDTAIILATFLTMGRYLEARAKGRTSDAIKKLMGLQPKTATVLRDSREIDVAIEAVLVDDIVLVKPGGKIPVDGQIIDGESYLDESMITGESIPALRKAGDHVVGGTLNKNSVIKFRAQKIGKDTVLSQIISLVERAQGSKPPMQRIADRVVQYFIPTIIIIALLTFIIWYLIAGSSLLFALTCTISVLVIACPCALGLATPTAVTVGIGRGAELGILIKEGEALEISEKLDTIIFDKTGTLTKGTPEVTDIISAGISETELLKLAASLEKNSQHPLGDAIVAKANEQNIALEEAAKFDTFGGKGVGAMIQGKAVLLGNRLLLQERHISYPSDTEEKIILFENQGKTTILVAIDNTFRGIIALSDTLKETSPEAVKALKKMGLDVIMITGDNARTAKSIAAQAGINEVLAEVLPRDKAAKVEELQKKGKVVAFVGDGINDAPALAQANLGIAIGSGTDVAIESGQIVLIKNDLIDAVATIELSRKVISRIRQNLFWAFAYNVALIPIAAGILYPFFGITLKPELAGLAMAMSSVTVITLSLMLRKYMPPVKLK